MHSAIYEGTVRHRRRAPMRHEFTYRLFMMYLDLAELPTLFAGRWFWSARRAAPARFLRRDYLGAATTPLDIAVRDRVEASIGRRPAGPIRMLTHLRYFGYCFNPVTFYYCFAPEGERLDAVAAEITNTPWGERHTYVFDAETASAPSRSGTSLRFQFPKAFHISPFMDMALRYDWRISTPGRRLATHFESFEGPTSLFDATMVLNRREITGPALARAILRYPWMTAQVVGGIYWQALRLRLKKAPFHSHPQHPQPSLEAGRS